MRLTHGPLLLLVLAGWLTAGSLAEAAPDKALKYHRVLQRRPAPGYLFDRFFNAWVEEESVESLETFLSEKADASTEDGLLLAYFHAKQGDDLRAIEQFRKTLADEPGAAAAWYEKAVVEARSLNFETALEDLVKAAEAEPDDELSVRVAKLRARLLVRSDRRDDALKAFAELIAASPDDEELAEDVIELQVDETLYDEAAALCTQLVERTKDPYRKLLRKLRLASIHQQAGKQKEAIALYQAALGESGAESWLEREILAQIERAFRREEDLGGLKKEYETLLESYPRRVGVLRGYARVLADSGEGKEAIERFRQLLAITPGDRENQQQFVDLHFRTSDFAGARKLLETLIQQHPQDAELPVQLAEVAAKLEDNEAAEAAVDSYLKKSDGDEYAHLRAARLLDRLKLEEPAKAKYALLTEKFPESRSAKEARAAFLYKSGDKPAAIGLWKEAAAGGDAQQHVRIARALGARQEHEAAYQLLQQAREGLADDTLYLGQLVDAAIAVKKYEEAIPHALKRVDRASIAAELDDALVQAARAIDRGERVVETITHFQNEASLSPQRVCLLSELLDRNGDPQRADDTLTPLIESGDPLAVSQQIRLARSRQDWPTAIAAAERALDLPEGRNSRNLRRLVEFYERGFRPEEALKRLSEWKRLSPGSSTPWLTESRLLQSEGKESEAIEALRLASRRLDDPRDVRARLAQLYTLSGKLADAERLYWLDYEESEDLLAKIRAVEQLARVAENRGKTAALVANFEERRRENRTSIEPLMALAAIHRISGDYAKRVRVLADAAKMRPDDLQLLNQIARVQEQEGDWEAARDTLRRAVANDKTKDSKRRLARLLIRWGESDEGYQLLNDLIAEDSDDPRELEKLADAMVAVGDWERAVEFLEPLVEQHPNDYRLRYLYAVCLEEEDALSQAADQFLRVLSADQEVAKTNQPTNPMHSPNWYWAELEKIAPSGLSKLFEVTQSRHTAYAYRQRRNVGMFLASSGHGANQSVTTPAKLSQAHAMALAHLSQVSEALDEEEAETLRERITEQGGAETAAAFAIFSGSQPNSQGVDYESLGEAAELPAVMAFYALRGGNSQGLPAEFFIKAVKRFEKPHPQLALMAALNGLNKADEGTPEYELLSGVAERLLAAVEDPSSVTVSSVCQWRSGAQRGRAANGPDRLKDLARDRVLAWYPSLKTQQNYGPWILMQVTNILRDSEDPEPYLNFMQAEVDRHQKAPGKSSSQSPFYRPRNQLIELPKFPPSALRGIPSTVATEIARRHKTQNISFGFPDDSTLKTWTPEKFREALTRLSSPLLRVLLLDPEEDNEEIDEAVKQMLAESPPTLDAYWLAATWEAKNEKSQRALELLNKARFLPMKRDERRKIDGALVALTQAVLDEDTDERGKMAGPLVALAEAVLGKGKQDKEDKTKKIGRDAALRLRHGRLQPQERTQLADALSELGLEREAERLEKAGGARVAAAPSMSLGRVQPTPPDQIRKMIDAGRKDSAARRLAQEVRGYVAQLQQNPHNRSYINHMMRQLKDRISGYALQKETLKQLDPGVSKSHRKHAEFALALELMGEPKDAIKAYERALEIRPKEDAYRVKLMISEAIAGDLDKAQERLAKLQRGGAELLTQEIVMLYQDHETGTDKRVDATELGCLALEAMVDEPQANVAWGDSLRQAVANQSHSSGGFLPPLYSTGDWSNYGNQPDDDLRKRRRELHDRICRALLRFDSTACSGFAGLQAAMSAANEESDEQLEELREIARESVLRFKPARSIAANNLRVVHYSNNRGQVRQLSPAEYLVRYHSLQGDPSAIDDLHAEVEKRGHSSTRRAIEQLGELYAAEPDDYLAESEKLIRSWRSRNEAAPGGENKPEMLVLDCAEARRLEVDLSPLFDKLLKQAAQNPGNTPQWWIDYAAYINKRQGADATKDWIEQIAEAMLGPKSRRQKHISTHYTNGGWSWNSPNGRMHEFEQLLNRLTQDQELLGATVLFISEGEVGQLANNALRQLGYQSLFQSRGVEEVISQLEDLHLLGAASGLPLKPLNGKNLASTESLANLTYKRLDRSSSKQREELAEELAKRDPQTFGSVLARYRCRPGQSEGPDVLAFAVENLDELESLPEDQAGRVALLLGAVTAKDRNTNRQVEGKDAYFDWLDEAQGLATRDQYKQLEEIKRFEELGVEGHEFDEWLAENLAPMSQSDPQRAAKVYLRACELFDDATRRGTNHYSFSQPTVNEMLTRLNWRWREAARDDPVGPLRLALVIMQSEEGAKIAIGRHTFNNLINTAKNSLDRLRNDSGGKRLSALDLFKRQHEWLHQHLGDLRSPTLYPVYKRLVSAPNEKDLAQVIDWLGQRLDDDPEDGFAAGLLSAARLQRVRSGKKPSDRRSATVDDERYLSILQDDAAPIGERVTFASQFYDDEYGAMPLSLANASVRLAAEAAAAGVVFDTELERCNCQNLRLLLAEDPENKDAVAGVEAWLKRFVNKKPARRSANGRVSSVDNINYWLAALELASACLERGDVESAAKIASRYGDKFDNRHEAIALYTKHGLIDDAARLVRTGWNDLSLTTVQGTTALYDLALEEALPDLKEKLNGPLAYVAEASLARLPDDQVEANAPELNREQRLVEVAKRFEAAGLEQEAMIETALLMLRDSQEASDVVYEPLAEAAEGVTIVTMAHRHTARAERVAELKKQHALVSLRRGEVGPAVAMLDKLSSGNPNENWQLHNLFQRHANDLWTVMLEKIGGMNEEEVGKIADQTLRLATGATMDRGGNSNNLMSLLVISHSSLGRVDAIKAALDRIPKNRRQRLSHNGYPMSNWKGIIGGLKKGDPDSLEERIDRAANAMSINSLLGWNVFNTRSLRRETPSDRDLAAWEAMFTDDELSEAALAVAERATTADGSAWASAGLCLAKAEQHALAAAAWEEAFAAVEGQEDSTKRLAYGARLVKALADAGDPQAAQELLVEITDKEKPNGWVKGLYDRLAKRFAALPEKASSEDTPTATTEETAAPDNAPPANESAQGEADEPLAPAA
ncbi:Anaphase-promoting complex, cyclosome, subunit 3 [Planctomycetes bacterium MalM25]|nr:Anaphase-promoting complex, cyclosome, subunit 3 [Planctomycetes bacterium MalM25]